MATPVILARQLRNIGLVMAQKLVTAGIDTPQKLRALGAKEAFLRIHRTGGFCGKYHAVYLYALEGALRNCDWVDIPQKKKQEFKDFTASLRSDQS